MIEVIRKPERESGWRISDMRPSEVAMWKGYVIIALQGGSNVELHTTDEHRMTPGTEGEKLKKYFFFNLDTQQVISVVGTDPIEPLTLYAEVTPGNENFATASNRDKYCGVSTPPEIIHNGDNEQ